MKKCKCSSDRKKIGTPTFYCELKVFKISDVWGDPEWGYFSADNPKSPKEKF